jgi:hypothetical protein
MVLCQVVLFYETNYQNAGRDYIMIKYETIFTICILVMIFVSLINIASEIGVNTKEFSSIAFPVNIIGLITGLVFIYFLFGLSKQGINYGNRT